MPTLNDLIDGDVQQLDTGFTFTEGPLYHPNGFYYFVDVRESKFYRIKPGEKAELLRENTGEGNGTTFQIATTEGVPAAVRWRSAQFKE